MANHVVIEIKLNFTLDLKKRSVVETLQVLIKFCGVDMGQGETTIAIHHTMTYKVQSHLFSLNHSLILIVRISGDAKVQISKIHKEHKLTFLPSW